MSQAQVKLPVCRSCELGVSCPDHSRPAKRTAKKSEGTVTIKIKKVNYVTLMEQAVSGKKDRGAMQQVIEGLIKPLEVSGAPELLDCEEAERYVELDTQAKEIKEEMDSLRVTLFTEAAKNEVVRFRVDRNVSLMIVDSSSSRVDTTLLTPEEEQVYNALKAKATVKSPVLALKRGK